MGSKRTFNGCWTCRIRKVKCDTRQPSCLRCEKAKLNCQGYDIKLGFYQCLTVQHGELVDIAEKKDKESKYNRRNVSISKFPESMMYYTFDELTEKIEELDKMVELGNIDEEIGPFRVFFASYTLGNKSKNYTRKYSSNVANFRNGYILNSPKNIKLQISHQINNTTNHGDYIEVSANDSKNTVTDQASKGLIHKDLVSLAKLTIYGLNGPDYKINDQNLYHITYPKFFPMIDSDEWLPKDDYLKGLVVRQQTSDKLVTNSYIELMQEFKSVEFSFVKMSKYNVWDIKIKPMISNIMYENMIYNYEFDLAKLNVELRKLDNNIGALTQSIKFVINLLVLSICSFNKSVTKYHLTDNNDIDEYLKISISLRKVGLNILNYHLDEYDTHMELLNENYNILLLLTIILEIEIDTYFNIFENFELLFSIAEIVYEQPVRLVNEVTLILKTVFKIMLTFYKSTQRINEYNYQIPEHEMKKYKDLHENYDLTKNNNGEDSDNEDDTADDSKTYDQALDSDQYKNPTILSNQYQIINQKDYNNYDLDLGFNPSLYQEQTISENSVYLMYGLPKSLIDLFRDSVELANHKRVFHTEKRYPRNFPRICSELEDKLEKWTNKWELGEANGNFRSPLERGMDHYIKICHNCIKIYFKRLIKNEIHQNLIEQTYREIEKLYNLHVDIKLSCWMIFILDSDNINPNTKHIINHIASNWKNLTYWRSRQVIIELNNRRQLDPINWMELIREWDIILYLG